jgi:hypothetical protein
MLFELDEKDLIIIDRALQDRPFKEVAPLIDKINAQIQEQSQKKNEE